MKTLLLILLLVPMISFGQTSSHIISGIDLNKDWYTLTNLSELSYYDSWVSTGQKFANALINENYLKENAFKGFLKIGFERIILVFGDKDIVDRDLHKLSPYCFIATKEYDNIINYNDFDVVLNVLKFQYGKPNKVENNDWGDLVEWNFDNAQILLTTKKNETRPFFQLLYLKNDGTVERKMIIEE